MGPNEPDDNIALLMDEIQRKAKEDVEISDAEVDRVIDYMRHQRAMAQATGKRPTKPKKPKEAKAHPTRPNRLNSP